MFYVIYSYVSSDNNILKASLEKAKAWVKELQRQANANIVIALVGNKLDLVSAAPSTSASSSSETPAEGDDEADAEAQEEEESSPAAAADDEDVRQVPTAEAEAYAKEAGLLFFEASAKAGTNVNELFTEIGTYLYSWLQLEVSTHIHILSQPRQSLSILSLPNPLAGLNRTDGTRRKMATE